jgi:hypothetical protein
LIEEFSFRIILSIWSVLFVIGLFVHFIAPEKYPGIGAFLSPLLSGAVSVCSWHVHAEVSSRA